MLDPARPMFLSLALLLTVITGCGRTGSSLAWRKFTLCSNSPVFFRPARSNAATATSRPMPTCAAISTCTVARGTAA